MESEVLLSVCFDLREGLIVFEGVEELVAFGEFCFDVFGGEVLEDSVEFGEVLGFKICFGGLFVLVEVLVG